MRTTTGATARRVVPTGSPSGLRAVVLAAGCGLLPLLGQLLFHGRLPAGINVALCATAAAGGSPLAGRRRSDLHRLAALAGTQAGFHLAYWLPGGYATHDVPAAGHPSWELLATHAITVLVTARLLGVTDALLDSGRTFWDAARQRLAALRWSHSLALVEVPQVAFCAVPAAPCGFRAPPGLFQRAPPLGHPRLAFLSSWPAAGGGLRVL